MSCSNTTIAITIRFCRSRIPSRTPTGAPISLDSALRSQGQSTSTPNKTALLRTRTRPFPETTFANSIANPDGGTHLTGFRTALTRAINQYAKQNSLVKDKDPSLSGDDVRE